MLLGLIAGYYGGHIDNLMLRLMDIWLAFPGILLALAIIAILGPSLFNVMMAVGLSAVPRYVRITRDRCSLRVRWTMYSAPEPLVVAV